MTPAPLSWAEAEFSNLMLKMTNQLKNDDSKKLCTIIFPTPKKGNAKECSNYHTIALISHASKVVLKILQARLQQCMNHELPDFQAGFKKRQRNQKSNCQHPLDHRKSKSSRKTSTSALLTMPKPLTVWITINCGKF